MTAGSRAGVVYLAGTEWHHVGATDRHLTTALAELIGPSLYVDPVVSLKSAVRRQWVGEPSVPVGLTEVAPGVTRLRAFGPPFLSRPGVFALTRHLQGRAVRDALRRSGIRPRVLVLATPSQAFPAGVPGTRVIFLTDDWEAGAALTGGRSRTLGGRLLRELRRADLACAVSPLLVERLASLDPTKEPVLLPNGCVLPPLEPIAERPEDLPAGPLVGLVGQLNERIDIDLVEAIADRGMSVVLIGPLTCRSPAALSRYHALFRHRNVTWLGRKTPEDLRGYLPHLAVGITPYLVDEFNLASFPLKTLEYLSYGLPVVASDLPATRWLDSSLVDIADTSERFVGLVAHRYAEERDPDEAQERRWLASQHTWGHRAAQLADALASRPHTQTADDGTACL